MDQASVFHEHDHGACITQSMQTAEALLARQGARLTPVRRRTLEILLEAHRAMGAYEVLDRLAQDGFGKQPPVVYRALDFLVEHGLAHRIQRLNAFTACTSPDHSHAPAFLICRNCNTVAEADAHQVRAMMAELAQGLGFTVERSSFESVGLCSACAGKPE
ncbi:Fur family transcriptional regulator [Paracoccus jiaweipingae]|uniref:Fur family transcriptional regulator n=1 Tax=unclassified Paracoccus (in: a-proteobacteria) TaxID=2688777 RepID=UPI0037A7CF62